MIQQQFDSLISHSYPSDPPPHPIHPVLISHIGGHKYAGNVIVYPSGTWYGRVTPCHVPHLLLAHCQPSFQLAINDPGSGEIQRVAASDENAARERNKLTKLIRGHVDPL